MVGIVDIRDETGLIALFDGRPRRDSLALSHRAALRVLPVWHSALQAPWARRRTLTVLPVLRCHLIASVARRVPEFRPDCAPAVAATQSRAAERTAGPAYCAATSAAFAAAAAGAPHPNEAAWRAVRAALTAADISGIIRRDADLMDQGVDLAALPLWDGETPEPLNRMEEGMLADWQADHTRRWDFWISWWRAETVGDQPETAFYRAVLESASYDAWRSPDAFAEEARRVIGSYAEAHRGMPSNPDENDLDRAPGAEFASEGGTP